MSLDGGAWLVSEVSVLLDDDSLVSDDSVLLDDDSSSSSPQSGRIERILRTEPRFNSTGLPSEPSVGGLVPPKQAWASARLSSSSTASTSVVTHRS